MLQSIQRDVRPPLEVEVGTNKVYGSRHQHGHGSKGSSDYTPARPYLGLSPDNRDAISELIQHHMDRKFLKLGGPI